MNYLLNYRLQWGQPDTLSVLRSSLDERHAQAPTNGTAPSPDPKTPGKLPPLPPNAPRYFRADIPPELLSITMNDWPYSGMWTQPTSHIPIPILIKRTVPADVEHSLIWSRVPIFPPDLPPPSASPISARLHQDGLWGFTGTDSPPPSPSTLPACLPALADWGVTMEKLVRSPRGTAEEECAVKRYGEEIETFVKRRWNEREWETAWFVNPPVSGRRTACAHGWYSLWIQRLQSVPDLTHIHVFARRKTPEQIAKSDIDTQHE